MVDRFEKFLIFNNFLDTSVRRIAFDEWLCAAAGAADFERESRDDSSGVGALDGGAENGAGDARSALDAPDDRHGKRVFGRQGDHGAGRANTGGGQLMSYLMFQDSFTRELIALGYQDTMRRSEDVLSFIGGSTVASTGATGILRRVSSRQEKRAEA